MQADSSVVQSKFRISGNDILFLTSGCCEDTGQINGDRLEDLGLQFGEFDGSFYPLTDHESQFIAEDLIQVGDFSVLTGYSVLFEGKKYLAPTIEMDFFVNADQTVIKKAQAEASNRALRPALEAIANQTGGHYCWEEGPAVEFSDNEGKFVAELLIPFDYAEQHAHDFESWKDHLTKIGRKAQEPITS